MNPVHDDGERDGHDHAHDEGLSQDLGRIVESGRRPMARRGVLALFGAVGAAGLVACAEGSDKTVVSGTESAAQGGPPAGGAPPAGGGADSGADVAEGEIPEETNGPYPADGTNGVNVLTESGVVRSDITSSFGSASGVAAGVPLTLKLKVYDLDGEEISALAGAAVYVWHCDRDGNYSLYSEAVSEENYLRGVQAADESGNVTFTTIFPAAYMGRWPHIHFEIYPSLDDATSASNRLRTSQLAFPEDVCDEVYANADGYGTSASNMEQTPLDQDNVFSDGHSLQMAKVTGSMEKGYVATLNVPV
ncbi:intradiol ring-cleavage dioxygenase [Nocardioides sp. Root140]|uniref:intradiol ring-cleavage dioxygenase n=1 Tax=Nocardioides sp. Root140 TaxID=1736460 RepID=UPI0006FFC309|nr:intradiol ring-cleavage dioxygenase [Nocardioides sp. Root140]KQY54581.1 hypothetical protein ASD30_18230 [Nocardioides sp. Root140]